jgi:hypothetical protein
MRAKKGGTVMLVNKSFLRELQDVWFVTFIGAFGPDTTKFHSSFLSLLNDVIY